MKRNRFDDLGVQEVMLLFLVGGAFVHGLLLGLMHLHG